MTTMTFMRWKAWSDLFMPLAAGGMGSSGSGTMQAFGNTALASSSKYATTWISVPH